MDLPCRRPTGRPETGSKDVVLEDVRLVCVRGEDAEDRG